MYSPFTKKDTHTDFPPYLFEVASQSYLNCCLQGYSLHFAPNKTELTTHIVQFF